MTSLTFLSLAGLLLPFAAASGNTSGALVKDAACQAKVDSLSIEALMNNPCESNTTGASNGTCPTTCAAKIENVTAVCQGKNYETDTDGKKVVKPFSEGKIDLIFVMETFAKGNACKMYLFDQGYAAANTCELAYTFAAKEIFFSPWCGTGAGEYSETSCHANCQKVLTNVFSKCNDGDVYGMDDAGQPQKYDSNVQPLALKILGPSTCNYVDASTDPAVASFSHKAGYSIITLLAATLSFLMI